MSESKLNNLIEKLQKYLEVELLMGKSELNVENQFSKTLMSLRIYS